MDIRPIKEQDLEGIMELVEKTELLTLERAGIYWMFWHSFRDTCFVAVEKENPIGIILGYLDQADQTAGYTHELGVDQNYRGKGIGTALLTAFEDKIKQERRTKVSLNTLPENENARKFYLNRGYTPNIIHKFGKERIEFTKNLS